MKNQTYFIISFILIMFDQISKYIIRLLVPNFHSISVIGNFFRITHLQNTGAAFSLSFGNLLLNKIIFLSVTFLVLIVFVILLRKSKSKYYSLIYSLIIAGATGNFIDRLTMGSVTDFLDFDFPDFIMRRWPVFNLADSTIVIAMVLLIYGEFFMNKMNDSKEDK
jgi:signal peptidase II